MTVSLYLSTAEAEVVADALGNIKTGDGTTVRSMTDPSFIASHVLYELQNQIREAKAKEQAKQEAQT